MTKTKPHCESDQQHEVVDGEIFGP
ncbi:MAG: hypothetical protein JWM53_2515, partial [bacterium]|nr:hypothetical protein [bacterium]